MFKKFFFNLCFHILVFKSARSQESCELKKSNDSIFVYTCKSPDTKLKSIKASFNISTNLSTVAAFLLDVNNYTQWQYNTIEASVIQKTSDNDLIYRSEIKAPWPVSNRDLVMHLKITQEPLSKIMTIDLKSIPGYFPEKMDVVRIPQAEGQWVVQPVGSNKVHVSYHFLVDPGGSVPVWLINLALAEGPYQTFRNLKMKIYSDKMKHKVSFISD